jgi:hypothetical protein
MPGTFLGGQGSHLGGLGAPSGPQGGVLVPFREALGAIFGKSAVKRSSPTAFVFAMRLLIDFSSILIDFWPFVDPENIVFA